MYAFRARRSLETWRALLVMPASLSGETRSVACSVCGNLHQPFATKQCVHPLLGCEPWGHWSLTRHGWSVMAVPIRDPLTGFLLKVVDVKVASRPMSSVSCMLSMSSHRVFSLLSARFYREL